MNKTERMQNLKKAIEARKPKIVFENKYYRISEITLNYKIDIKRACKKNLGGDRDCYSNIENGLSQAHEVARYIIDKYFII